MATFVRLPHLALAAIAGISLWIGAGCDSGDGKPSSPDLIGGGPVESDPISVSGFEPPEGLAGDTLVVRGSGFRTAISGNVLTIGGATIPVVAATESTLVAVLPTHSSGGVVRVADVSGWRFGTAPEEFDLRAPASLEQGFTGDAGQPVITSDLPLEQAVDSTTTALVISGTVNGDEGSGYWAIVDGEHFVRSQGQLEVQSGSYQQTVPLFCGDQRLLVFFKNASGRSFYRNDLDRQDCTEAGIRVQLSWDTDETDVDTHLLQPGGRYRTEGDCYFANCTPYHDPLEWGSPGIHDNPTLDVDDTDGFGPENIFVTPSQDGTYTVRIHYFSDDGVGPSNAWVEVFIHGARAGSFGPEILAGTGSEWTVCTILWPSGLVTAAR